MSAPLFRPDHGLCLLDGDSYQAAWTGSARPLERSGWEWHGVLHDEAGSAHNAVLRLYRTDLTPRLFHDAAAWLVARAMGLQTPPQLGVIVLEARQVKLSLPGVDLARYSDDYLFMTLVSPGSTALPALDLGTLLALYAITPGAWHSWPALATALRYWAGWLLEADARPTLEAVLSDLARHIGQAPPGRIAA